MTTSKSPLNLSRDDAVAKLNRVVASLDAARKECRDEVDHCLIDVPDYDVVRSVLSHFDHYAVVLKSHFDELAELKFRYPEAWDLSEGGRRDREVRALRNWLAAAVFEEVFGPPRAAAAGQKLVSEAEPSKPAAPAQR